MTSLIRIFLSLGKANNDQNTCKLNLYVWYKLIIICELDMIQIYKWFYFLLTSTVQMKNCRNITKSQSKQQNLLHQQPPNLFTLKCYHVTMFEVWLCINVMIKFWRFRFECLKKVKLTSHISGIDYWIYRISKIILWISLKMFRHIGYK